MPKILRLSPWLVVLGLLLFPKAWGLDTRYIIWKYKRASSFVSIREFFNFPRAKRKEIILRTHPRKDEGLYLIMGLSLDASKIPAQSQWVLDLIFENKLGTTTYNFKMPLSLAARKKIRSHQKIIGNQNSMSHPELWLGLTGPENPGKGNRVIAWRIRLLEPSGQVLFDKKSWLWRE